MKVYYRVSDKLSSNPNPLGKNKQEIIVTCMSSFLRTGVDRNEITIIHDGGDVPDIDDWRIKSEKVIYTKKTGLVESLNCALDEVCKLPNEENVFLVEDDYLWIPDCLPLIERALDTLPLISPYDHPGHYMEDRFKNQPKKMVLIENQTYRQAPSNTHTFACKAWVVKQNVELIKSFGMRDHDMFTALGIDLYVPVPSFATHLVTGLLAPNIQWKIK